MAVYGTTDWGWLVAFEDYKDRALNTAPGRCRRLNPILNLDGAFDLTDSEEMHVEFQSDLENKIQTVDNITVSALSSAPSQGQDWKSACPRVYARLSTFNDVTDFVDNNDSSNLTDSEIESSDSSEIDQLVQLSSCCSDLEDWDNSSNILDVEGTDKEEWIVRKSNFPLSSSLPIVPVIQNSDTPDSNIYFRPFSKTSVQSKTAKLVNNLPDYPVSVQICCKPKLPFQECQQLHQRQILNVDGAWDLSDSEEEENVENDDSDANFEGAEEIEDSEEVEHESEGFELNDESNGANDNSEEVVVRGADPLSDEVFVKLVRNTLWI